MDKNIPSGLKISQMAIKYTTIFNSKGNKNYQIGIFGLKIYHLATLVHW
jgi:hypothetical protein